MSNISLLEMSKTKKRGAREAIISILSREFPMTIKKLYNKAKKEYNFGVTYQAVFKLVKGMVDDDILEKLDNEYKLNINWVRQLKNEIDIIERNYLGKSEISGADEQSAVNEFVSKMGPRLKDYLGKDKACIVGVSGLGARYAIPIWKYLKKDGLDVNFVELNKAVLIRNEPIKLNMKDFENRKVVIIDYAIYGGTNYRLSTGRLSSLKKKFKIIEIKYAVNYDSLGLADFSLNKA